MKAPIFTTASLIFGLLVPLTAQNLIEPLGGVPDAGRPAMDRSATPLVPREAPVTHKARASVTEAPAVYSAQDTMTLEPRFAENKGVDSVVDLSVLEKPSPFRHIAAGRPAAVAGVETDGIKQELALISATYRVSGRRESNCQTIALSVEQRIKLDSSDVLEIVETEVKSNPSCVCEIVKAAIKASDADTALVVSIVEISISAAPESMRVASQCAIAAVPESLADVQALLSRYDANAGDGGYSSKSSKEAKDAKVAGVVMPDTVAAMPNPLDFPGQGPIGAPSGGQPYLMPMPPVVIASPVTEVSP